MKMQIPPCVGLGHCLSSVAVICMASFLFPCTFAFGETSDPVPKLDEDVWPELVSEVWKTGTTAKVKPVPVTVKGLGGTVEPRRAKAGSTVRLRYDYAGPFPSVSGMLDVEVFLYCGKKVRWSERLSLSPDSFVRMSDRTWRIEFDYVLPVCLDSCDLNVRLESQCLKLSDGIQEAPLSFIRLQAVPGWETPIVSSVRKVAGYPYFTVNGKVLPGLWGAMGRFWRADGTPRHSSAPLDFVTVWNQSPEYWPKDGAFDPSDFDRRAEAFFRAYPTGYFIWSVELYVPPDWAAKHPDEMVRDDVGRLSHDPESYPWQANYSFASTKALDAMSATLEKAIRYLESSPYANRIAGYRIVSGHTIEWLGWDPMEKTTILDFSPAAQKGFELFSKRHYPELTDFSVPPLAERQILDDGELLWNQRRHMRTIAYHDFYSSAIADMASTLCGRAKQILKGRKLVGTYYGYSMTLNANGRDHMRGHFAMKRFLDADTVDFILSPQDYYQVTRGPGSTLVEFKPFASIQRRGIVSAVEDDTRTHNIKPTKYMQSPCEAQTIQLLRRNMGIMACRNQPFYTLPLTSGYEFDFPAFVRDAESWRNAITLALEAKTHRNAEIAVVVSEEAIKSTPMFRGQMDRLPKIIQQYRPDGTVERYSNPSGHSLAYWPYRFAYNEFARIGSAVDYVLAEDLVDAPGDYKLYIFQCCTKRFSGLERLASALRNRPCTIVWTYAPGYTSDDGNSVASMKVLTGADFVRCEGAFDPELILVDGSRTGSIGSRIKPLFALAKVDDIYGSYATGGKVGFGAVRTGMATTVFSGTYRMEAPVLQEIARRAGVHLYSGSLDPVEANENFVTLHARTAGRKTIRLRRKADVVDVFDRRIVARGTEEFSFDAPLHSSWLFYFADNAKDLSSMR